MSLLYVIDAYNIIRHTRFTHRTKNIHEPPRALSEFIIINRLTGSRKNKIILVFDGYPDASRQKEEEGGIEIIFSQDNTADAKIKQLVENAANPKNIVVVSDDKEIRFFVRSCGAACLGVEEFIGSKNKLKQKREEQIKSELSYTQIGRINNELKGIWLKGQPEHKPRIS